MRTVRAESETLLKTQLGAQELHLLSPCYSRNESIPFDTDAVTVRRHNSQQLSMFAILPPNGRHHLPLNELFSNMLQGNISVLITGELPMGRGR